MITPREFVVTDFIPDDDVRTLKSISDEALTGSVLVDNLILLRYCELQHIQKVLRDKYKMPFAWLRVDPTPEEYKGIAEKHNILIERSKGQMIIVYVPLGQIVDDALLQIDIPQYELVFRYVADCNVKIIRTGLSPNILSFALADFRPLLVFRRLIQDCIDRAGTDLHLQSDYVGKRPRHRIMYRISRQMETSVFGLDYEMMQRLIQAVVGKLTPTSVMDVDAPKGIQTSVRDLFGDGAIDLRVTSSKIDAGYYMVVAIQSVNTTTKTVDELGFPKADVDTIRQIAKRRTGLTLVTGEMRSGKNTTIFAMLNEIINDPIQIMEYSSPIENHMSFQQYDYMGDLDRLEHQIRLAKKQDIDIAVLNEIPNAEVAFAVRDLVNSAIGVITTTHVNRVWHLPNKLNEFFGSDYKTMVSQLNACINHKMFRRWSGGDMHKRMLVKEQGEFELFCYTSGVRQYFVPEDESKVKYELQPMVEIMIFTDAIKTAMLNFDEIWRAEQMITNQVKQAHATLENRVAEYVNAGIMSLEEMRKLL